jgi:hypothetical protein
MYAQLFPAEMQTFLWAGFSFCTTIQTLCNPPKEPLQNELTRAKHLGAKSVRPCIRNRIFFIARNHGGHPKFTFPSFAGAILGIGDRLFSKLLSYYFPNDVGCVPINIASFFLALKTILR